MKDELSFLVVVSQLVYSDLPFGLVVAVGLVLGVDESVDARGMHLKTGKYLILKSDVR